MVKKNLYDCHVFVCTNKKDAGKECCADKGSLGIQEELKKWAREKFGTRVRINKTGCLDQCAQGIVAVIYPKGDWHLQIKSDDIEELKASITKYVESAGETTKGLITK